MAGHIGEQFGNYRLIQLLGQGGFAEVYLGKHIHLDIQAAIKLLHRRLDEKDVEQFRDEAQLLALFDHPHIVKVLDFGIQNNTPFLAMTYAPNGTLRQKHPKGIAVPLLSVITYVNQIAAALQYVHFRKHVHRDIKPQNILVGPDQHLLLSDFGISIVAHDFHSLTSQIALGTPYYMAPEQFQGKALRASDQYSLGVMVYEWLSGELPFTGDLFSLMHQHTTKLPSSLREKNGRISIEVENVILKALAKDPQNRFDRISAFARALEQASFTEQHPRKQSPAGTLLQSYQAPQGRIYSFSWMQNTPRLATRDADGKVEVQDLATGSLVFSTRENGIDQILWSPNSQRLACITQDRIDEEPTKLHVWNPDTGKLLATYTHALKPLIWSPDGTRIAFLSYSGNHEFQIWDIERAQLISTLPASNEKIGAARPVWSPDGKYVAFSPEHVGGDSFGQWVIPVHEVEKKDARTAYPLQLPPIPRYVANHPRWSLPSGNLTWSPDGTYLANWATYSCRGTRRLPDPEKLDEEQRMWEEEQRTQRKAQIWATTTKSEIAIRSDVLALAWSPDSTQVAFALGNHTVEIWDISADKTVAIYRGHTARVAALAWSPDEKHLASASIDGTIHIWDAHDAKRIVVLRSNCDEEWVTMEWSSDGTQLAFIIGFPEMVGPVYDDRHYTASQSTNIHITYNAILLWQVF